MTNQYPHRQEMNEVLDKLKNMVMHQSPNDKIDPFVVIYNYYYIGMADKFINETFSVLSDLE